MWCIVPTNWQPFNPIYSIFRLIRYFSCYLALIEFAPFPSTKTVSSWISGKDSRCLMMLLHNDTATCHLPYQNQHANTRECRWIFLPISTNSFWVSIMPPFYSQETRGVMSCLYAIVPWLSNMVPSMSREIHGSLWGWKVPSEDLRVRIGDEVSESQTYVRERRFSILHEL
jgi:hypothetical protein